MRPCDSCISKDVCKYKEVFLEGKKILEDEAKSYILAPILTVEIGCKFRKANTVVNDWGTDDQTF